jgi:hypothetical protein
VLGIAIGIGEVMSQAVLLIGKKFIKKKRTKSKKNKPIFSVMSGGKT